MLEKERRAEKARMDALEKARSDAQDIIAMDKNDTLADHDLLNSQEVVSGAQGQQEVITDKSAEGLVGQDENDEICRQPLSEFWVGFWMIKFHIWI